MVVGQHLELLLQLINLLKKEWILSIYLRGGSNSQTAPDAIAINNATLAGVTAVIATGNSGPERSTIGNPASSALAISVGNSTLAQITNQANLSV